MFKAVVLHHVRRSTAIHHLMTALLIVVIEILATMLVEQLWLHITVALSVFGKDFMESVLEFAHEMLDDIG